MKTIREFDFKNKRVLVRCDFNVPLDKERHVLDTFRLEKTLPTIDYLQKAGAKIILISHLGSPGGQKNESLSLGPIKRKLEEYLKIPLAGPLDLFDDKTKEIIAKLTPGQIVILENLRFYEGEEKNDSSFVKTLASLAEIYINEAFSCSHRDHASIVGLAKFLPSCAGILFEKEIASLQKLLQNPQKPLVSIIGGKKVETKAPIIDMISENSDWVLISGLIAKEAEEKSYRFKYPQKIVMPKGNLAALDVNNETVKIFEEKIKSAKTIFWNGPFGMIEKEEFAIGTKKIAEAVIASGAYSVIGGGETLEFVNRLGLIDKFSHVSTGGGAMLDFLADGELVGLTALNNN